MIVATYTVICTGCGAQGPSSSTSPGRARDEAKRDGWTLTPNPEPGQREPVDLCSNCATTKET
jgi:hypothetical protein